MDADVSVDGIDALQAKLRARLEKLRDPSPALAVAGQIVADGAKQRIKDEGLPDQTWAPNVRGGHVGYDTGRMIASISSNVEGVTATVGTNVRYARWFQEGTGIYAGHEPWTVEPRRGRALRFTVGGHTFFARKVVIPGQPPRPFLVVGERERDMIQAAFERFLASGSSDA